jgi:hypothetical protein
MSCSSLFHYFMEQGLLLAICANSVDHLSGKVVGKTSIRGTLGGAAKFVGEGKQLQEYTGSRAMEEQRIKKMAMGVAITRLRGQQNGQGSHSVHPFDTLTDCVGDGKAKQRQAHLLSEETPD